MTRVLQTVVLFLVPVLILAGCNSNKPDSGTAGNQNRDQRSENGDQDSTSSAKPAGGIVETLKKQANLSDLENLADSVPDDIDDLMTYLSRKRTEQTRARDGKHQFAIQLQRETASRKLLELELNDEQRFEAIRIRLDSLLKLIAMGDPNSQNKFLEFVGPLQNDRQPRVVQAAAVAGLVGDYSQRINKKETDLSPVIQSSRRIAEKYRDSFEVCKEISNLGERILQRGDRESWREMSHMLVDVYHDSPDETSRNFARKLEARIEVSNTNLDVIMNEIQLQKPGAMDRYRTVVNEILSSPTASMLAMEQVARSLKWLEGTGNIVETREANRIVMTAALGMEDESLRTHLQQACTLRANRLELVGKPFAMEMFLYDDRPFDWEAFSGNQAVMVVFWSPTKPESMAAARRLAEVYRSHKGKGLKYLAVNLSTGVNTTSDLRDGKADDWESVKAGGRQGNDSQSPILDGLNIENVPHLVLVGRTGVVESINPSFANLESAVDKLLR